MGGGCRASAAGQHAPHCPPQHSSRAPQHSSCHPQGQRKQPTPFPADSCALCLSPPLNIRGVGGGNGTPPLSHSSMLTYLGRGSSGMWSIRTNCLIRKRQRCWRDLTLLNLETGYRSWTGVGGRPWRGGGGKNKKQRWRLSVFAKESISAWEPEVRAGQGCVPPPPTQRP